MPCTKYDSDVVLCRPPRGIVRRKIIHCPVCQRRRRFVVRFMGWWYGSHLTCVACGDTFADGEMLPRPFQRGWRNAAKRQARDAWTTALSPREYERALRELWDREVGHV